MNDHLKIVESKKPPPICMGAVLSEFEQPTDQSVKTSIANLEDDLRRLKGTIHRDCVCHTHSDKHGTSHDTKHGKSSHPHDASHHEHKTRPPTAQKPAPPAPHLLDVSNCEAKLLETTEMKALQKSCKGHENPHGITPHDAMGAIARHACDKDTNAYKECGSNFAELTKCMVDHKCDLAAPMVMHNRCEPEMQKLDQCLVKHKLPDPWQSK